MFTDRTEAAYLLAEKLEVYKNNKGVVLAVPRGGVPIGYIIAKQLGFDLEVILTKKIGHPTNPEFAIGSVSLLGRILDEKIHVPVEYIERETKRIRESLLKKYALFQGDKKPIDLKGKIVIIADDGIATGNTILATIDIIRRSKPAKIIVAVPVLPQEKIHKIEKNVDRLVYLEAPYEFYGVGQFYENFNQVTDEEVMLLLKKTDNKKEDNRAA